MQPIRKRGTNPRIRRLLWGIPVVAAILILVLFVLDRNAVNIPADTALDRHDDRVSLLKRDRKDLLRFEVFPSFDDKFAIQFTDGSYQVEGQPDYPLEQREIDLMVTELTTLNAFVEIDSGELKQESLNSLGLGEDAARVSAHYADGQTASLMIGSSVPGETPADYLMMAGDPLIYSVSTTVKEVFDRGLNTLHPVPRLNFNSELVDAIRFEGEGAFALRQDAGLWQIESPIQYPTDGQMVRAMLLAVEKMRLAVYVGPADPPNLARYGFVPQSRAVVFELAESVITGYDREGAKVLSEAVPQQTLRFSIGNRIGTIGFYCLYDESIYQASLVSMGLFADITMAQTAAKTPANIPVNRLRHLKIQESGDARMYDISLTERILPNNQIMTDENGNLLFEPIIYSNGAELDSDFFLSEYLKLMALAAAGEVPAGYQPDGKAERIYLLETASEPLELALYPFDALHYAMRVNGVFLHYILRAEADGINL